MASATTKTIRLPVHGNVKLPDLHAAIARPVNLTGGLGGVDLEILGATRPWKANPTKPSALPRHDHDRRQPRAGYHV